MRHPMPAIQKLLERLGFVKLDRFGLVLTPDGRILSMRPAVLDDGLGGRIVGWEDSDLAAAELGRWEAVKPVATRVPLPAMVISPAARPPPLPKAVTAQVPVVARPVAVAPKAEEPEDDWEWTIALARARAAADEVLAAKPPPLAAKKPALSVMPREPLPLPPSKTEPMAVPSLVKPARAASPSPRTIIPVPKLASVAVKTRPFEPVAKNTVIPMAPRRMARGTHQRLEDTRPMIEIGEQTQTNVEVDLPDQTRPSFVLPSVARAR